MNSKVKVKSINSLSNSEKKLINYWIEKEFGEKYIRDFKKDYPPNSKCFLLKQNNKILAFGTIRPVTAKYKEKNFYFYGIGDVIATKKRKGLGRKILETMINHLKENEISGIGFCARKNTSFYKKVGMEVKKGIMKRFRFKSPKTNKFIPIEKGDGIFYNSKDFLKTISNSKSQIIFDTKLW